MRAPQTFSGFDFESTLAKMARVLTRQYGIEVAFSPDGPRVEAGRIVIPMLEAGDPENREVLTGYLDLLVARCKYSALSELEALGGGLDKRVVEVVEDARVCALLLREYPGTRWFFDKLRAHAARDAAVKWPKLVWREKFLWLLERQLWQEALPQLETSPSLLAVLGSASAEIATSRLARSTGESIASARAILRKLRMLGAGRANNMMLSTRAAEGFDPENDPFDDPDQTVAAAAAADDEPPPGGAASQSEEAGAGMSQSLAGATLLAAAATPAPGTEPVGALARSVLSLPLTTAFDTVTDVTGGGPRGTWHALRLRAREQTGPLKTKLERALRADELTHWKREQERGEIDRVALVKLASAPGYRTPFKVKRVTRGRDTAVTLLLDLSGSMAGEKMALAQLCAAALGDALTQLDFDCEILGYSSIESAEMRQLRDQQAAAGTDLHAYNRFVERLDLWVYKRFGSADLSGVATLKCGHENPDGECLAWAAGRLAEHAAKRRILMTLSDGYPATGDGNPAILRTDLHARIEAITRSGIELVGIGILDDAVETFYPNSVVVRQLNELPQVALQVLSAMLLRTRHAS